MPSGQLEITTHKRMELLDITSHIERIVVDSPIESGAVYLFNPHTTAGITINEGADPDVCLDIIKGFENFVPRNLGYRHAEGNSAAHIMTMLTGGSLTLLIENSKILLGTWQKIFFCEFDGPRARKLHWKIIPEAS